MKKITKEVLDIYVRMVAALTESEIESTERMLDLYYRIRSSFEEEQPAERKQPKTDRKPGKASRPATKAAQKEQSPSAKAAAFKRETLERMRKALKEEKLSYPKISETSGIDEVKLIRIMEGKQEPVEVYRKLSAGLDKLES